MIIVITLITFLTVLLLCMIMFYGQVADKRTIADRMGRYIDLREAIPQNNPNTTAPTSWRTVIRKFSKYFDSPQWAKLIEHKLIQAGIPLRSSEYMVIWTGLVFMFAVLLFVLTSGKVLTVVMGALIGYAAPLIYLNIKIQKRAKAFNEQLGDALILIANSLRTGYSFMQAIEMVSREMLPPISVEFARLLKEMNLGISTEEAMNNLAKRVDSDDLDLVITAVVIQRQVGGNLAEVLDNIAGTIRERVRIKGQIKTLTAQGRISGFVIGGLPFALALIMNVLNPEYVGLLFTTPMGKAMLGAAVFSQILGVLVIRRIIDIEI